MTDDKELSEAYNLGYSCAKDMATDEIERLRADNEKLKEALRPFAELADMFTDEAPNTYAVKEFLGRFRSARKALGNEDD